MKKYVLGLLVFSSLCFGQNVVIYRWVDTNNVVHFSQHQPAHDNYTTMTMSSRSKQQTQHNTVAQDQSSELEQSTFTTSQDETTNSIVSMTIEQRCKDAQDNIKTLSAFDQVQYTDGQGQVHILSKEEKRQQLMLSQKQIEIYCQ